MYLLLDVTTLEPIRYNVSIQTNQNKKKNPPPMPQQKLPKVIREHLPPDFDLHEPTLISPKRCLSAFFQPH